MTNAEKFKEVFGFTPNYDCCPFPYLDDVIDACVGCSYAYGNVHHCSQHFWSEEYRGEQNEDSD